MEQFDRKCLWAVIFCIAEIFGGFLALILLTFNVSLSLAVAIVTSVCMIIFSLYKGIRGTQKVDTNISRGTKLHRC